MDNKVPRKLATQYTEHLFLDYYQDNVIAQFNRVQRIFVNSEKLKTFIRNFGSNNTINVRRYVYIIYRLLVRYENMWRLNHTGLTSSQLNNYWRSSISDIALETHFTEDKIKTVLNSISKTPVEFCKAVGNKCFDVEIIDIFKNSPYYKNM